MSKMRQVQVRSLSMRYSPGHVIEWHEHSWPQLVYASEGVMTVETDHACWVVPSHRGIWVPPGKRHQVKMHGCVFLQTIYWNGEPNRLGDTNCFVVEIPGLVHELIVHICSIGIVQGDSDENRNLIDFLGFQLERLRPIPLEIPMPRDSRARRLAKQVIESPGMEKSLSEMALDCGISLRTMQRVYSAELGMPLARWRNQVRMIHAVQLLVGDKSVTQIAMDLGFESASSFIYSFRGYFGESPGRYRSNGRIA